MLKAKLVVVGGEAKQTEVRLKVLPTIIGRAREATLTLPHPLVSRQHCEIFEKNGRLYVKDLSSLNGTYLNNERIDGVQPFNPDQLLTLGNVTFRAVYELAENKETDAPSDPSQAPAVSSVPAAVEMEPIEIAFQEVDSESSRDGLPVIDRQTDRGEPVAGKRRVPDAKVKKQADFLGSDTGESSAVDAGAPDESNASESIGSSDILAGAELKEVADKSVSDSAIAHLPTANEALSFAGGFELLDAEKLALEQVETIQIDLGKESSPKPEETSSTELDSFVRKLPK